MTIGKFYPPGIFHFLLNLAHDNDGLPVKEIETILLREQIGLLGFTCDRSRIAFAKKTGEPYCKDCWTRHETAKPPTVNFQGKITKAGEYAPIETFLDRKRKADAKASAKVQAEAEDRIRAEVRAEIMAEAKAVAANKNEKEKEKGNIIEDTTT